VANVKSPSPGCADALTAVEPPPSRWGFPDPAAAGDDDLVGVGADLEPGTILAAYRRGLFPMNVRRGVLGWWSPDPRGVLPLDGLHVSSRLRRSMRRFEIRIDTAFSEVLAGCAHTPRPGGWITPAIEAAYTELFALGWAHSVEVWSAGGGELAGGLYGLAIGGLFAGESMFHRESDASKAAVAGLVEAMGGAAGARQGRLFDVQWQTEHLASLGVVAISRSDYLVRLTAALRLPLPPAFAAGPRVISGPPSPEPGRRAPG
jgi:leucyl/phenylalanyl-tRNA--protein transferase